MDILQVVQQTQAATYVTWCALTVRFAFSFPRRLSERVPALDLGLDTCPGGGIQNSEDMWAKLGCAGVLYSTDQHWDPLCFHPGVLHGNSA